MTKTNSIKNWTEDFHHENGNYQNKCCYCTSYFFGHKRRVVCKQCAARQTVLSLFTPPFKADLSGQFVMDAHDQMVTEVRSWGMMQYQDQADLLHDELCRMVADALNEFWAKNKTT